MVDRATVYGLVAYDGTDYHGFQVQTGVPTIQGELESALNSFTTLEGRVVGSGRTDTGVHAVGQVVAATIVWRHSIEKLQQAWNAHLPKPISVVRMGIVPVGFHPRFSALRRTYRYTIRSAGEENRLVRRSPLTDRYALFVRSGLDLNAMDAAAQFLVGEYDFATFGQPTQGEKTVRCVTQAKWQVVESDLAMLQPFPGPQLVFTITANGFLRRMVRNIVGSLLEVGRGRWKPEDLKVALKKADRYFSAPPAPPNGLVLERVDYPNTMLIG